MQNVSEPSRQFEKVAIDIVGPLTRSEKGNRYIMTCQDQFTCYPEAVALPDQSAVTVATAFMEQVICRHGVPEILLTDRGTNFTSALMKEICELLGMKHIFTSAYNPAANGRLERAHQSFAAVISCYVNQDHGDWDSHLQFALFAYRNAKHRMTQFSPALLVYGRDLVMPWDTVLLTQERKYAEEKTFVDVLVRNLQEAHAQAV